MDQEILTVLLEIKQQLASLPSVEEVRQLRLKVESYEEAQSPLLNQSEAANYLGVSPSTIGRMRENGQLKFVMVGKAGKSIRIRKSELDRYNRRHSL